MTDEQISDLFAEGTAPEADPAFARRVAAGIARARLGARLQRLALAPAVVLMLSGATFLAGRLIKPALTQAVDGAPQVIGVPLPVVLGVVIVGLALSVRRYVLRADAGAGLTEPIE